MTTKTSRLSLQWLHHLPEQKQIIERTQKSVSAYTGVSFDCQLDDFVVNMFLTDDYALHSFFFFTGCPSVCGHTLTSLHVFLWADKRNWWTLVAMLFSMIVVFCLVSPGTSESNCSCGIKRADRIVGGFDVSPDQWPWQVSLVNVAAGAIHWCGGALIASRWILTAAHCLHHQTADKLIVRLGSGVVHFVCIFHVASLTFLFHLK